MQQLLDDLRAGGDAAPLRNALVYVIADMPAKYTGLAFERLAAAVEELRTNGLPAAEVPEFVRRRTAYAPREQDRQDRDILGIPESTVRTRAARMKTSEEEPPYIPDTPRVKSIGEALSDSTSLQRDGRTWTRPDRVATRLATADSDQEADELLRYARTPFQRRVAWRHLHGHTNQEIAAELGTTPTRIKRTITTLRHEAGYDYPAA